MKKVIELTKDYANKKKGEKLTLDSMLASSLVHQRKVAKYFKEKKAKAKK